MVETAYITIQSLVELVGSWLRQPAMPLKSLLEQLREVYSLNTTMKSHRAVLRQLELGKQWEEFIINVLCNRQRVIRIAA